MKIVKQFDEDDYSQIVHECGYLTPGQGVRIGDETYTVISTTFSAVQDDNGNQLHQSTLDRPLPRKYVGENMCLCEYCWAVRNSESGHVYGVFTTFQRAEDYAEKLFGPPSSDDRPDWVSLDELPLNTEVPAQSVYPYRILHDFEKKKTLLVREVVWEGYNDELPKHEKVYRHGYAQFTKVESRVYAKNRIEAFGIWLDRWDNVLEGSIRVDHLHHSNIFWLWDRDQKKFVKGETT